MDLRTASAGSYPRIGDDPDQQALREACARFARGELGAAGLRAAEDDAAARAIAEQIEAGLDVVTDGLVRWYDPISHVAQALMGIRPGPLRRFFDTGMEFRQPIVRGPIVRTRALVTEDYAFAAARSDRPVKAVLTGPLTLAAVSVIETPAYPGLETLTETYAEALAGELAALGAAGARLVQLDEPAALAGPAALALLGRVLPVIVAAKGDVELMLALPFGDPLPLWPQIARLPVDVVALDLTGSPHLEALPPAEGPIPRLALGLVDARTTAEDDVAGRAALAARVLAAAPPGPHYLTTSCGLEMVPRAAARRKLALLGAIRAALNGGALS